MACHWVKIRDPKTGEVLTAHVNMGRDRPRKCAECGEPRATLLCDGPLPAGVIHRRGSEPGADSTCSRPICKRCAIHVPPDSDFCRQPACRAAASEAGRQLRMSFDPSRS